MPPRQPRVQREQSIHDPAQYSPDCRACPRLAGHLKALRAEHPDYHNAPVAPFGDPQAGILIVGLAPGRHGANRTGRPFTGDYAGELLYQTLYDLGLGSQPHVTDADDGLKLTDCRITNAVKCLPPENKPTTQEIDRCNPYLANELTGLPRNAVIVALGAIAHRAILRALDQTLSHHPFAHAAEHGPFAHGLRLIDSYHCSRYNTQTGRLTPKMFRQVLRRATMLRQQPPTRRGQSKKK